MSLLDQLQSFRAKNEGENIESLTLEQLAGQKFDFGKAKMNQTYEEAFQDLEWTNFMVSRYEKSDKQAHQKFLRYVKLRTQSGQNTPLKIKTGKTVENKVKVRNQVAASRMEEEEEDSEWEQMSERPMMTKQEMSPEVESRFNRVEEALAQVFSHLQQLSAQGVLIQAKKNFNSRSAADNRRVIH
eukprot:s61_g42.t1